MGSRRDRPRERKQDGTAPFEVPDMSLSLEAVQAVLKTMSTLTMRNGDVLVMRTAPGRHPQTYCAIADAVAMAAMAQGVRIHEQIVILNPNETLEALDDEQLEQLGLCKKGRLVQA